MVRINRINQRDYNSWPFNPVTRKWNKLWLDLRQRLARDVEIVDGERHYRFRCETVREFSRCAKMFVKEPGTCDWIKNFVKPGDIFYDIGANIGIYTILAADYTGPEGKVYAFEPHSANFSRLLDNIAVNALQNVVIPCNFALHHESGFFPFNYLSTMAGSAKSQLLSPPGDSGAGRLPAITELKSAAGVDSLIATGQIDAPHHIKIDVDGNELLILRGMQGLLGSGAPPKSIQVELDNHRKEDIRKFMQDHQYVLSDTHFTRAGQKRKERGGDSEVKSFNALFLQRT